MSIDDATSKIADRLAPANLLVVRAKPIGRTLPTRWLDERRQHARYAAGQLVMITTYTGSRLAELVDLSTWGAKISIPDGLVPEVGQVFHLQLLDRTELCCQVKWIGLTPIGVEFDRPVFQPEDHLDLEHLGQSHLAMILRLQFQLQSRRLSTLEESD